MDFWKMAQRWHDTDHYDQWQQQMPEIGPLPAGMPEWMSGCWCCCEHCRRDAPRPNPFYERAIDQPSVEILR